MAIGNKQILELLKASTEFGFLSEPVLGDLADRLEIQEIDGGAKIVTEGELIDSMFVLISGRLRVSRQGKDGNTLLYNEILPGECVGEMGVILHQPRTADITALRKSVLGVLSQKEFENLLKKYPVEMNRAFSHAIYNHMRHHARAKRQKRAHSFLVVPLSEDINVSKVSQNLTKAFSFMGPAEHIFLDTAVSKDGLNFDDLETNNLFLVYQTGAVFSYKKLKSYQHADQILFVSRAGASKEISPVEKHFAEEPGFKLMRKHLIILHEKKNRVCDDRQKWREKRDVERVYPATLDNPSDYRRIARFLTSKAVGVVLGGGGARGFAHIGALRALEEADIPVDLLGGNSMGALIGACYAFGIPLGHIHREILRFAKGAMALDLPIVSILSGKNFKKALLETFDNTQVQSLWLSYFAAACNLSKADTAVLDSGPLWQAILASNSPAGLLPPVIYSGQLLVDGSALENVPVQAMRKRLGTILELRRGNGAIIAIDVDVKKDLTVSNDISSLTKWNVFKSNFSSNPAKLPNLKDILIHSSHIGGLAQRGRIIAAADYYLEPPVSHFPLTAYKNADEIIAMGYEYTAKQIAGWESLPI